MYVETQPPADGRQRPKLFNRDFLFVLVTSFVFVASFTSILPALPLYVKSIDGGDAAIGLMVGVAAVASVIGRLASGRAIDLWGRKPFLFGGALVLLAGALTFNFATDVPSLLFVRFVQGIGIGVGLTAASVLAVDVAPAERRAEGIGYLGTSANLALALAPGLGLSLLSVQGFALQGFALAFTASSAFAAIAVVGALLLRETGLSRPPSTPASRRLGVGDFLAVEAIPVSLALVLSSGPTTAFGAFLPVYAARENVAAFYFLYATVTLCSRPFAGMAADRFGARTVAAPGMAACATGALILSLSSSLPAVAAAGIVYGLGWGIVYPSLMALAVEAVQPKRRGAAMGTFTGSQDAGVLLAALPLGLLAQAAGYQVVFLAAGGGGLLALTYFLVYPRLLPKRLRATTPEIDRRTDELADRSSVGGLH